MVGRPVAGSIDVKVHFRTAVVVSSDAFIRTMRFVAGRRSTSVLKEPRDARGIEGGVTSLLTKLMGPRVSVLRLTTFGFRVSMTETVWAGAVAADWLSK